MKAKEINAHWWMNKENVRFTYNGTLLNFSKEGNAAICDSMHGHWGFPSDSLVKNPPAMQKVQGASCSTPGSGRSPGGGHGNPFQYSCLENPMDRGAWWATVHGVTRSRMWLNDWACTHAMDQRTLCYMKSARSRRTNIRWYHLHKEPKTAKHRRK